MNRALFKPLGLIIFALSCSMLFFYLYAVSIDSPSQNAFFLSFSITLPFSIVIIIAHKSHKDSINYRDGALFVTLSWISIAVFGCLPFFLSPYNLNITDSLFEAVSGFTATGATILKDVEVVDHALLLWRSFSQWIGGMGIVVLVIAIIPYYEFTGSKMYQAEAPGPFVNKLTTKIEDTAKYLWCLYCGLTFLLVFILYFVGMNLFDAINHAFTTMSTGGFSTKNNSIGYYNSPTIEWVLIVFMFLGGVNFVLHFIFLFRGFNLFLYFKDAEFNFYLKIIFLIFSLIFIYDLTQNDILNYDFSNHIRDILFSVISIITTTGFSSVDYNEWSFFAQFILIMFASIGGCAGSTAGGVKMVRALSLIKFIADELIKNIKPGIVRTIKINKAFVGRGYISSLLSFLLLYLFFVLVSIMIIAIEIQDPITAISAVIASLANIGPGLGEVGPLSSYYHIGDLSKWVLFLNMIIGRLEIITVFILFLPQTWKN